MKKTINIKELIILCLFSILLITPVFADSTIEETTKKVEIDLKTEKIKTENVSMNTYIDQNLEQYKILDSNEIETTFISIAEKSFKELSDIDFNHEEKLVTIEFMINEDDGNTTALINTGIYNFLKGIKEVINYSIDFEAIVRYTDSNGRYLKKPLYRYSYKTENLISFDWENMNFSEITSLCNETYIYETDEVIKNHNSNEDNLQVKIINILKYYIGEKISNKKDVN